MENDNSRPDTSETIGAYLRAQRMVRNISLEEVSESTGISTTVVLALENENREQLPAEVYIKAFYKKYAEYLGLDPEEIKEKYQHQDRKNQKKARSKSGFNTVVTLKGQEENLFVEILRKLFLPITILILGALLYWVYKNYLASYYPFGLFQKYSLTICSLFFNAPNFIC